MKWVRNAKGDESRYETRKETNGKLVEEAEAEHRGIEVTE